MAHKSRSADERPVIELSRHFVSLIDQTLKEAPVLRAAIGGIYEGRSLKGNYALHIIGARLIPIPDPPKEQPA